VNALLWAAAAVVGFVAIALVFVVALLIVASRAERQSERDFRWPR
jgi:hypothetical protein